MALVAAEPFHPSILARTKRADLDEAEQRMRSAVIRGFKPLVEFMLENWERELPLATQEVGYVVIRAREHDGREVMFRVDNTKLSAKAKRFAILPDEWTRHLQDMARELADGMKGALQLGGDAANAELGGIDVDWSLSNEGAQRWLASWSLELAKGLTQTTKERLRATLVAGVKLGEGMPELGKRVRDVAADIRERRAQTIAQTEVITSFTKGSLLVYEESGVVERVAWLDGQSGACSLCQGLDGKSVVLGEEFEDGVDGPPRHPGCRCAVRAAL